MQNPAGAVIGAVIIGVALLILARWELVASGTGMASNGVCRLDRWTGAIVACAQKNSRRTRGIAIRRNERCYCSTSWDVRIAQGG
jgi:hypothetical protein